MKEFPENDVAIPHALGRVFLGRGKTGLAVELFEHVVRVEPQNPLWLQSLADGLHAHGNDDGAIEALERAIEVDPFIESSYRVLATIYITAGKRELATQTWERYLDRVPDSIYARQAKDSLGSEAQAPASKRFDAGRP
jgi:Tfp pilus assembly protein PilF